MGGFFLYLSLAVATLAVSWAAIIIRLADADPISTAFYRMTLSVIILAPFSIPGLRANLRRLAARSDFKWLVASGIVLGLHFAAWITSLKFTSISNSVIIVATQPFFVAAMERVFLKEKISRQAVIGMALAFVGMVIISRSDLDLGSDHLLGDFLALAGALCAAIYLMFGRKIRQTLDNRHYVFPVYLIASLTLLIIALPFRSPLTGFSGNTWFCFFLLALIPTVLGHTLYNYLLKFIRAHLVAITILGEPIGATIIAALLFKEYPSTGTYIGGGLILTGIIMALARAKSDILASETP
ncbi:MAG: DMT family transporter [candidate division Zixibacteria bacterium]|nr:DMT family transporter [candidate division Zixibacteria bacterium]